MICNGRHPGIACGDPFCYLRAAHPRVARRLYALRIPEVAAGADAIVTWRPQRGPFRPLRVGIPESIAPHFDIRGIRIGLMRQIDPFRAELAAVRLTDRAVFDLVDGVLEVAEISADALPLFGMGVHFDTVQMAQDLVVEVSRFGDRAPGPFEIAFAGLEPLE